MSSNRLRIAMQKSGRLSQDSQDLLKSCGLKINKREDRLIAHVENMPIDILRVRDDDIPGLVMDGVVDLGIVGENVLEETRLERVALGLRTEFKTLRRLDYGHAVLLPCCFYSFFLPCYMPSQATPSDTGASAQA